MRIVTFPHTLRSDWNHGNAHFLRGLARALRERGHEVVSHEARHPWSVRNLVSEHGADELHAFQERFGDLDVRLYDPGALDLDAALEGADVALVHEWNDPALVRMIGRHRARAGDYHLLFHDTHHRSVTKPKEMAKYDLSHYDGVLAFGDVIRDIYLEKGWAERAWTWHEAADVTTFHPIEDAERKGDLVWIGNWGDGEREKELDEFLFKPVRKLGLKARVHGVRYPPKALRKLKRAGIKYADWLPNFRAPEVFAQHAMTVHVPRRPYVEKLPGIPTIRVFEALASGIPLICAPWEDAENLFHPGKDYLVARDGREMRARMRWILDNPEEARRMAEHGRRTILARHTCGHRADELLRIVDELRGSGGGGGTTARAPAPAPAKAADAATPAPRPHAPTPALAPALAMALAPSEGRTPPHVAFFASSLVSSYWNGAATYYRGVLGALAKLGCRVTFYEPDWRERQAKRDIPDPDWAKVVVYPVDEAAVEKVLEDARGADVVVKASGVGVFDDLLEREVLRLKSQRTRVFFWDVDAPATLDRVHGNPNDPFRKLIPQYDMVFTYGGGPPVVEAYEALGARRCVPVYNALDPETHHPVQPDQRFDADLALMANRLPDREKRIEEFFLHPARKLPGKRFVLGGEGWGDKAMPPNVRYLGHVSTRDHNAFNATPRAVLNVARASMARYGYSPATRVFEAAGAGACVVTDDWVGIDHFLEPGKEILVARDGDEVARILEDLTPERAREIGEAARRRVLRDHTYDQRARLVLDVLDGRA